MIWVNLVDKVNLMEFELSGATGDTVEFDQSGDIVDLSKSGN